VDPAKADSQLTPSARAGIRPHLHTARRGDALRRSGGNRKTTVMNRLASFAVAALAASLATAALAQQQRPGVALDKRWPGQGNEQTEDEPLQQRGSARTPAATGAVTPHAGKAQPAPPRVVNCGGVFAKDSSHIKLATFFGADAITWTQVAGPENSKLNASVLYPKDPKRRLEVLWNLDDSRSDTQLIVINGQSTWTAPNGLKLGMPLAAIEKLNKKPFNLHGFSGEQGGFVTSWEGGALASLPGGCKVSIRFAPDAKQGKPPEAELLGDKDFPSSHPGLRATAPKVTEIILGY
jgi:hypothetical protein